MNCLKAAWTVKAGIVVGHPITEHQRQWTLISADWDGKTQEQQILAFHQRADAATAYVRELQNPGLVNWVTLEFLWI